MLSGTTQSMRPYPCWDGGRWARYQFFQCLEHTTEQPRRFVPCVKEKPPERVECHSPCSSPHVLERCASDGPPVNFPSAPSSLTCAERTFNDNAPNSLPSTSDCHKQMESFRTFEGQAQLASTRGRNFPVYNCQCRPSVSSRESFSSNSLHAVSVTLKALFSIRFDRGVASFRGAGGAPVFLQVNGALDSHSLLVGLRENPTKHRAKGVILQLAIHSATPSPQTLHAGADCWLAISPKVRDRGHACPWKDTA
ncbi:hypothetical protein FRC08_018192 [Ceratobasidium sp. 394]|nr:hypothetical protein FRC08_018192 [Ceratobasidium sp. 394]